MASLRGQDLLVATSNSGKRDEFSALLKPFGVRLFSLADFAVQGPDETEYSFLGNALVKARAAAAVTGLTTLADDSGLAVDDLGGSPGIYTADWAETGRGRDFTRAMEKTWHLLLAARSVAPRRAEFRCALAVVWPDGEEAVFEGRVAGQIVWPMRGQLGHGYDPIFVPDGHSRTLGEMSPDDKNRISHRAEAFKALIKGCFT